MCQRNDVEQLRKQQKTGRLFETLTFLEKQMNDEAVIQDADTVLADILEEADFEITGIAADLLKIHQNSKDRESVETCFEVLTKNTNGKYPLSQISGQERKRLKEKYGVDKIWDVEEIYQVGARNIWYYNVMAEQKQAA